ncbi:MAG: sensor histidine kinase, partial [Chloroflexota bacterium]
MYAARGLRPSLPVLLLLVLPALLGGVAGAALERGLLPGGESVFVFRLQAPAGAAVAMAGTMVSLVALLGWWARRRWHRAVQAAVEAERRAQAEAHRRFVRRLDHEVKNPLTAVRAAVANLEEGEAAPAAGASLDTLRRQVGRLSKLLSDLRKLADLEAQGIERAAVDVEAVLGEAVALARATPAGEARRVTVSVQGVPWRPGPLLGDGDLLLLAVYNLVDNALKFSSDGAAVEVRAREDGAGTAIEVADTGGGIAGEDLPHVAEELYRGEGARGTEGSGLGLALVDRIAALHGGRLTVRSRLGQGTLAILWL